MQNHKICIVSVMNDKAITMMPRKKNDKIMSLTVSKLTKEKSQIFIIQKKKIYYIFRHCESGKVFDVFRQKLQVYAEIIGYDYHDGDNQMWILQEVQPNAYIITSAKSKLVLEIQGGIDADGMRIVQNKNYKYKNQLWRLKPI